MGSTVVRQLPRQTLGGPQRVRALRLRRTNLTNLLQCEKGLRAQVLHRTLTSLRFKDTAPLTRLIQPRQRPTTSPEVGIAAVAEDGQRPRENEGTVPRGTVERMKGIQDPLMELVASMENIGEEAMGEALIENQDHPGEGIPLLSERPIVSVLER